MNTDGIMKSGMAIPFSNPNCAVATCVLSPEARRHTGSTTAFSARAAVTHSRASTEGAHRRNSSRRRVGLGSCRIRVKPLAYRIISTAHRAATLSAAGGIAARIPKEAPGNAISSPSASTHRTVCSVASLRAGRQVSSRP